MPFKSSSARNPETPRQSTPAKTPPLLFPRTRTSTPAENAVPRSPAPPPETVSRAANNPAPYERAYCTLRELQQKTEPKKQKSEPEPLEPPKPNGGIQTAVAPERAQPSEPETKIKKRIQAPPLAPWRAHSCAPCRDSSRHLSPRPALRRAWYGRAVSRSRSNRGVLRSRLLRQSRRGNRWVDGPNMFLISAALGIRVLAGGRSQLKQIIRRFTFSLLTNPLPLQQIFLVYAVIRSSL